MQDIITRSFEAYFNWAATLPPIHFSFLIRALLLYGLPCLFCAVAFIQGNRSVLVQTLCFTGGLLLAAAIPVHSLTISNRLLRGWLLLFGGILLAFLPAILPAFVFPTIGMQKKARVTGYILLSALFLANLILAWRHQ